MGYNESKALGQRRYVEIFEMDLDINDPDFDDEFILESNTFGTPRTTTDSRAYKEGVFRTYRYTNQRIPANFHYYPNLDDYSEQSTVPAVLKPGEGIASSATATVTLRDFMDNDAYPLQGVYAERRLPNRGSHFKRLIQRNYIRNRPARIKRGYIPSSGLITDADFQVENYIIKDITDPNSDGIVKITLQDQLFFASNKKAKIPIASNSTTTSAIDDSSTSGNFTFLATTFGNKNINDSEPTVGEGIYVNIDNEIFFGSVTAYNSTSNAGTFNFTQRGLGGTKIEEHSIDSDIQGVIAYDNTNVTDIIRDIFDRFTNIDTSKFINDAEWDALKAGDLSSYNLTTFITQPQNVKDTLDSIMKSTGMWLYMDIIANLIQIGITPRFSEPVYTFTENDYLQSGLSSKPDPDRQVTRSVIRYAKRDYTEGDGIRYFARHFRRQNDILEADRNYGQISEDNEIKSIWYTSNNADTVLAQSTVALKVQRFADIPRNITMNVDSALVGDLPNGNRLWYGSTIAVENKQRLNLDDTPVIETAQVIGIKRSNNLDQWQIRALAYKSEQLPDVNPDYVITADASNVNLFDLINPTEAREYIVVINPSVVIGSTGISTPALTTGTGWLLGSSLLIYNFGQILGKGGQGGFGGIWNDDLGQRSPSSGSQGGDAIHIEVDTSIDNLQGLIGGGGAGGRGGIAPSNPSAGGGGGGGAGRLAGSGGRAESDVPGATDGEDGNDSFGGNGGIPSLNGVAGSKGGDLGESTLSTTNLTVPAGLAISINNGTLTILSGNNTNQIKGDVV